jgi:hypothetical protein
MSDTPTLYAWNARLDPADASRHTVACTLTPLAATNTADPTRRTCEEVLEALRIARAPVRWTTTPFRTSYYSAPDATADERWRVVWTLSMELDGPVDEVPRQQYEYFEVVEGGAYATDPPEAKRELDVRVIADFQDAEDAGRAAEAVRAVESEAGIRTYDLAGQFTQLEVSLGPAPPAALAVPFARGERVERICRDHGGIPNSTEREDTWDIVFDEDAPG